jgi:hypothetical protein
MKRAVVECTFPELKGGFIYKTGRGTGSGSKAAISRAIGDALKQVKGKRVSVIKASIVLSEVTTCDICLKEICQCGGDE